MTRNGNNAVRGGYLTTFQVAKLFEVSAPTVANWVDAGKLKAHRTPGGHRRIAREDVAAFAKTHDMPLPDEFLGIRKRVLVVDDERDFAELVREYLMLRGGFEVEVANSGFHAGFAVARFRPDLILMDIMMPDMDGFEAHAALRADPSTANVPILACTAYRDPEVERRLEAESFDGLVEKPLKLEDLLETVNRVLADR